MLRRLTGWKLVRREQRQSALTGNRSDEQVKLGQHPARSTKFGEQLCEFHAGLLVEGPQAQHPKSGLEASQILPITTTYTDAGTVLKEHR